MGLTLAFSVLELILVGVLLKVAATKHWFCYYAKAKTAASAGFLLVAAAALWQKRALPMQGSGLLVAALLLCAAGDVLLGLANLKDGPHGKFFKLGAAGFGLAHLFFCALFCVQNPFSIWDLAAAAAGGTACWYLSHTKRIRLKKLKPIGIGYGALVTLMTEKAIANFVIAPTATAGLLAVGSVLFWLSDLVLVFMYFGTHHEDHKHKMRFANLSFYYLGVLLMAISPAL